MKTIKTYQIKGYNIFANELGYQFINQLENL